MTAITKAVAQTLHNSATNMPAKSAYALNSDGSSVNHSKFASFLADQTQGFLNETKELESNVTLFSQGKLDIEAVASEVAAMGVKVDAAKRVVEELKTSAHSLLNMQI